MDKKPGGIPLVGPMMAAIEGGGVAYIKMPHELGKISLARLYH
jgi:hypothetical protein